MTTLVRPKRLGGDPNENSVSVTLGKSSVHLSFRSSSAPTERALPKGVISLGSPYLYFRTRFTVQSEDSPALRWIVPSHSSPGLLMSIGTSNHIRSSTQLPEFSRAYHRDVHRGSISRLHIGWTFTLLTRQHHR